VSWANGQEKPDDAYVVPLSPAKHQEQHSMNEIEFWKAHGFKWWEVVAIAQALYQHRNDLALCQEIIQEAKR
jgi:phosphoribosylformimino-5-aminoimidazole carboxamide ribonucleotide (ProFAR) isomerase